MTDSPLVPTVQDCDPESAAELARLRAERDAFRDQRNEVIKDNEKLIARADESGMARLRAENATRTAQREVKNLRARVCELEAERHATNEALSDAAERMRADRDRIAELEAERDRPARMFDAQAGLERLRRDVAAGELVRADNFQEAARLLEGAAYDDDSVNFLDVMASGIREIANEQVALAAPVGDPHDSLPEVPRG
ncbi:hypothetical protein [Streptomyces goshikiensis]|uniref:hypothetical protein n=1 Tax=Streptomyces goshikiensis TaxID=1942 RepID=UPI0036B7BA3F